jgi:hypothetical protein
MQAELQQLSRDVMKAKLAAFEAEAEQVRALDADLDKRRQEIDLRLAELRARANKDFANASAAVKQRVAVALPSPDPLAMLCKAANTIDGLFDLGLSDVGGVSGPLRRWLAEKEQVQALVRAIGLAGGDMYLMLTESPAACARDEGTVRDMLRERYMARADLMQLWEYERTPHQEPPSVMLEASMARIQFANRMHALQEQLIEREKAIGSMPAPLPYRPTSYGRPLGS